MTFRDLALATALTSAAALAAPTAFAQDSAQRIDDPAVGSQVDNLPRANADLPEIPNNIRQEAGLAADRLAFRASALSVEEVGDLEYAMTLKDLRKNVAERVATQRM